MGFFISLLSVCVLIFIALLLGVQLYARFFPAFFLRAQEKVLALAFYISFLVGGIILSAAHFFPLSSLIVWAVAGLAALGMDCSSFSKRWKALLSFGLCMGSVLNLYQFSQNAVFWTLGGALIWWGIWRLWVWFDRFPLISFLTSLSWMFALCSVGLFMHTIPFFLLVPVSLIGTGVVAVSFFQLSQKKPFLGALSASLAGFVWGGIWFYFLSAGAVFQVLTAFGYYLFEGIALAIACYYHRPLQTYLTELLAFPNLASKAVSVVFSHLLILSFLSAMTIGMNLTVAPVLLFALIIILVDLYLRLSSLMNPQPTWRELFKNTKEGLFLFTKQIRGKAIQPAKKPRKKSVKKTISNRKKKK